MARKISLLAPKSLSNPYSPQIILRGVVKGKAGTEDILRADSIVFTLEPTDRVWV